MDPVSHYIAHERGEPPARHSATSEQALLLPRPGSLGDAVVALLGLFVVLGSGFLLAGGRGRAIEFLAVTAVIAAGYTTSWRLGRVAAAGGVALYLCLEAYYGRLDGGHYWQDAIFATATGVAVLCAAHVRLTSDQRRVALADARDALEAEAGARVGARALPPLEYEIERARRHTHEVSLLVVAADDVDDVELRFGDEGIEAVATRLSEVVVRQLRATDVPLREGRTGYWIVLPQTPALDARAAAERVRLSVAAEQLAFAPGELVDLSVSVGVATFPDDGTTNEELVGAARGALGRAVELGGNRSVMSSRSADVPPGWSAGAEVVR